MSKVEVKNFSMYPLKKRPLQFEPDEASEPEDLSVKRTRYEEYKNYFKRENEKYDREKRNMENQKNCSKKNLQTNRLSHEVHPDSGVNIDFYGSNLQKCEVKKTLISPRTMSNQTPSARLPTLADFYLKLFQQSTQISKEQSNTQWPENWISLRSTWTPKYCSNLTNTSKCFSNLTDSLKHSSSLSDASKYPTNLTEPSKYPTNSTDILKNSAYLIDTSKYPSSSTDVRNSGVSPTDSTLSSPRSTSSEDSGIGCEFVSEDEIESFKNLNSDNLYYVNNKKVFCCKSCGKSYSSQSDLLKHSEICLSYDPKTFSCKHCSKAYTSIGALKMHIRTHTLPCKCHVCGKAFSRPWLLQGHIRTHTGEKPFECQLCHRSFADRSNLRAHQQTHENVKKYKCDNCYKTFSRMSLLSKHSTGSCPNK